MVIKRVFNLLDSKYSNKPQAIDRKIKDYFSEIKNTIVNDFESLKIF